MGVRSSQSPVQLPPETSFLADRRRGVRNRYRRRSGGIYLPLAERNAIAIGVAVLWAAFAIIVAYPWIADLADALTMPVAITVVAGIAIVPGYLNAHLLVSLMLDRPPPVDDGGEATLPAITVIVAAFNEEERIEETLRYALNQDYPGQVDVLVVDDGSSDGTAGIVESMALQHRQLRLLAASHGGKAHALNVGLLSAETPLVATCDADTLLMPYALRHAVTRLERSPADTCAVAGSVMVRNSRANWLTAMQTWDYLLGIASVKRQQSLMRGTLVAQGAFSIYRTDALRAVGGWPNMIGEDIVVTWAMLERGGRTTYEPSAVAFTDVPTTVHDLVRQRRRWARGMIEGLRHHGRRLLASRRMFSHAVGSNYLFPLLDLTFSLAFPAGLVLAATGNFMIVGPMTAAVLPLNAAVMCALYRKQRRVFEALGLRMRRHRRGLLAYFLGYQLLLAPVSLSGYLTEIVRRPRRW
jgi:biofilm PGA synthesis N-glycosyltransferase PgaC